MSSRKLTEKNVRKLVRLGGRRGKPGSFAITLPIELVEGLGWREKQKVVVKKIRGGLVIRDWKK